MNRRILAGLLGGLVAFVWSSIAHTVLPLGEAGVSTLPDERPVLTALQENIPHAGLYLFPAPVGGEVMENYESNPSGILVYQPPGRVFSFPRLLGVELGATLLAGFIVATLLSRGPLTVGSGAFLGALFGLFAWFSISVSYWNWYAFPRNFVYAEGADQVIGWLLGGAVMALVLGRDRR